MRTLGQSQRTIAPDVVMERNVPVFMPDGVRLFANVFRPATSGRYPAILSVTPYGKDNLHDWKTMFLMRLTGVRFGKLRCSQWAGSRLRRQIIIHATISLDGYIAGPNDDMSWMSDYVGPNKVAERVVREVGAIVAGGRYFHVIEDRLEASLPYGGAVQAPVFIMTHHPRETITRLGVTFRFVGEFKEAIQ